MLRKKRASLLLCLLLGCFLIPFLLVEVVPSGYLTAECLLTSEETASLYHLLWAIDEALSRFQIPYWLDYGTLLGAVRDGQLIAWDKDADVGYFLADHVRMMDVGVAGVRQYLLQKHKIRIHGRTFVREEDYQALVSNNEKVQAKVEFFAWRPVESTNGSLLMKHEFGEQPSFLAATWESQYIESHWVSPLWRIDLGGRSMSCPNNPQQFISQVRYPKTWNRSVPWKLSCFLPDLLASLSWKRWFA